MVCCRVLLVGGENVKRSEKTPKQQNSLKVYSLDESELEKITAEFTEQERATIMRWNSAIEKVFHRRMKE